MAEINLREFYGAIHDAEAVARQLKAGTPARAGGAR